MTPDDIHQGIRFIGALVFVLALMGGLSLVLRRLNNLEPVRRPKTRRLAVVESLPVDGKRRLMLVRRDGREHLLILGANGETVIESNIESEHDDGENVAASSSSPLRPSSPRRWPVYRIMACLGLILFAVALFWHHPAFAQAMTLDLGKGDNGTVTGRVVQLIVVMTVLSLAPSILVMTTSFTRIIVVLSFLRTAMGIQQTPPNTVIISLALFLTFFIMQPTLQKAYDTGVTPLVNGEIDEVTAFGRCVDPFRQFMLAHVRQDDLKMFVDLSHTKVDKPEDMPLRPLIPAFMISELRRAFEIGFMLFLPFLIIDMVTASILMSMGMMMLPPVMISLPFKIIFFVLVDGWHLICGSLIQSFGPIPG